MNNLFLSVVIPCYDGMANLQKGVLDKVEHFLDKKKFPYEVIVVDDGSSDGSIAFLEKFITENPTFQLIRGTHMGKGGAVTQGVLQAVGEYILFTDMDQAAPIEELDKLLPFAQEGYDVVIGSRSTKRKGSPFIRQIVSLGGIYLRKMIIGLPITDTQCGFKMFRQEVAKKLFSKINKLHHGFHPVKGSNVSYGLDIELLYLATRMGYTIKEVPVYWLHVETRRVNPLQDSIKGVFDLIKIKQNALAGKYRN